jgi:hypothetical protein
MWFGIAILLQGKFLPRKVGKPGQVRQILKYQSVIEPNF